MASKIWTLKARQAARARLREFEGTPHVHRRNKPGSGVDCVNLVLEALKAAGIIAPDFKAPTYRRTEGFMRTHNAIEDRFLATFHCRKIDPAEKPQDGDIFVFKVKRSCNHVGIHFGGELWHALWGSGTTRETVDLLAIEAQSFIRITGTGIKETAY